MNTQGVPLSMSFRDNVFEGTYIAMSQKASPNASTVVYVGDLWFPNGGCTEVTEVETGRQVSAESNGVEMFISGVEGGKRVNIRFAEANGVTYKVTVNPKTDSVCPAGHLDSSMPIA
uniref:Uncharacterized protein n=1 Tax=Strombidinopsis acuminata TaxID=141414 RepID=A0A7S3WR06_9SPIT|mmetsp:Transcript_53686/g.73607  ORF Transcript_53686/g.73607 Transcript_53686/m.73607 type:complete len:117 (+) Transcript_53686:136-486(+)